MAWLLTAVAVGVVGLAILWWRQRTRTPHTINDSITRFARARRALSAGAEPRAVRPHGDIVLPLDRTRRHVTPVPHPSEDHRHRASDAHTE